MYKRQIRKSYKYGLTIPNVPNYEPVWGGGAIRHIVTQRDYQSDEMCIRDSSVGDFVNVRVTEASSATLKGEEI